MGSVVSSTTNAIYGLCAPESSLITMDDGQQYRINKLIAEGGYSSVFLVTNIITNQHYALKRILAQEKSQIDEANHEISIQKRFKHKNLMKLLGCCSRGCPTLPGATEILMLMPVIGGVSCQERIEAADSALHGPPSSSDDNTSANTATNNINKSKKLLSFSDDELYRIIIGVCEGLLALHDTYNLCHRDIKPGNILIGPDGVPVIVDFGSTVAKRHVISNRKESMMAQDNAARYSTAPYRAPELYDVKTNTVIDERVDVWSMGCTIFALAYNYNPFEAEMNKAGGSIALAIMSGKFKFPNVPQRSSQLIDLIRFCLVVDHTQRPFMKDVLAKAKELCTSSTSSSTSSTASNVSVSDAYLASAGVFHDAAPSSTIHHPSSNRGASSTAAKMGGGGGIDEDW